MKPRSDTTPAVQAHYDSLWSALPPSVRFLKGISMITFSRQLLIAGIRARHPNLDQQQLREAIIRQVYLNIV